MSSVRNSNLRLFHAVPVFFAALLSLVVVLALSVGTVDAKKSKASSSSSKLPSVTRIDPHNAMIGTKLTITGKNFVKGKNQVIVIFQRFGSKRKFTARAKGVSTKVATLLVPDVSADLIKPVNGRILLPTDNQYAVRIVTKYGASKKLTNKTVSPILAINPGLPTADQSGAAGDCDQDGIPNSAETDADNDLLPDATETAIGTDTCKPDTDGDNVSDYYEYRVAYELNGGPTLPYPGLRPYPNPLLPDDGKDFDGDGLKVIDEFQAWQYTGHMDRFYSDANQDSDADGVLDGAEDEDGDKLPNLPERYTAFTGSSLYVKLDWLKNDSDGDGLCDGLDDEEHDGPPTPLAVADCTTPVPNNGLSGTPPSAAGAGDPNPSLIDADDNIYSNYYEWMNDTTSGDWYNPCMPSVYPVSPTCPEDPVYW